MDKTVNDTNIEPIFSETLNIIASKDNVNKVIGFVESVLEKHDVDFLLISKMSICVDELFSNICFYAYPNKTGDCSIKIDLFKDSLNLTFIDSGIEFDPTKVLEPNVNSGISERKIGGLGIFLVRKSVDELIYNRVNNQNILILKKRI